MAKPPDTTLRGKNPSSTFRFLAQVSEGSPGWSSATTAGSTHRRGSTV